MDDMLRLVDECHAVILQAKKKVNEEAEKNKNGPCLADVLQPHVTTIMSYCKKINPKDAVLALYPFIDFNDEGWLEKAFASCQSYKWEHVRHCYLIRSDRTFLTTRIKDIERNMDFLAFCLGTLYLLYKKEKELDYVEITN
ncbi:hypothetical protein L6270_01205 [Candidatus Parcubacteria bacterium]|nr:hypothetical protein [Patescibacteria group bacterium]MBU4309761.1 hypothetical protein [Patescibacteria group bacterium]MBU4431767.1 hypothetical protein [Patescibacteria group bacterium]MBU4578100.1 hypothetical protein [Patescibacteria group bacterium]MCG2696637.1 hypothetical protein [Candidatus Parcubacteria bacterium]